MSLHVIVVDVKERFTRALARATHYGPASNRTAATLLVDLQAGDVSSASLVLLHFSDPGIQSVQQPLLAQIAVHVCGQGGRAVIFSGHHPEDQAYSKLGPTKQRSVLDKTFDQLRPYQRGLHYDLFATSEIDARELTHVSISGFAPDWRVDRLMSDATFLRMVVRLCEPVANLLIQGVPQLAIATPEQVWKLRRIDRARLAALVPDVGAGAAVLELLDAIVTGTAIASWPELTRDVLLDYGEFAGAVSEQESAAGKEKGQQAYERFEHDREVVAHTTFGSGFSKKLLLASDDRVVRLRDYLKARPSASDRPPALPHELNAALVARTFADWPDVKREVSQLLMAKTGRAGLTFTQKGDTLREHIQHQLDAIDERLAEAASVMTRPALEQDEWCDSVADAIDAIEAALHKLSLQHGIRHVNTFLSVRC